MTKIITNKQHLIMISRAFQKAGAIRKNGKISTEHLSEEKKATLNNELLFIKYKIRKSKEKNK